MHHKEEAIPRLYERLDWLGNQIRAAYAEYLEQNQVLPLGIKQELNNFYSMLDGYQQKKINLTNEELAECRKITENLLKKLSTRTDSDVDHAFKA